MEIIYVAFIENVYKIILWLLIKIANVSQSANYNLNQLKKMTNENWEFFN